MTNSFEENIKKNRERLKQVKEDMLKTNHKGQWCWLTGKTFCQEGWCRGCQLYLDWKASLENIETAQNILPIQKEAFRKANR